MKTIQTPPALDFVGLRRMSETVLSLVTAEHAAGFRAVCDDALDRAALAAEFGDLDAARWWCDFLRRRLTDWSASRHVQTSGELRPVTDAFLRQWCAAAGVACDLGEGRAGL